MSQLVETHFCYGCIHGVTNQCMSRQSRFRRMNVARKRVTNCRFKKYPPEEKKKEAEPEPEPETETVEPDEEVSQEEEEVIKVVGASEGILDEQEVNAITSVDPFTGTGTTFDPDPNDSASSIVGIATEVKKTAEGEVDLVIDVSKEAVELGKELVKEGVKEAISITIDPAKGEGESEPLILTDESKIQPLVGVEPRTEDGPLPGGPTPPDPDEKKEKEKGPTGVRLHPKGEPDDGDNGPTEEKGKLFLEDIVKDIEEKSELPKNAVLKAEIETKPILASENCTEVLDLVEKVNGRITEPNKLEVDPKELFAGIEEPPFKEGTELGMFSEHKIDSSDVVFCFSCNQEQPIAYFSPDGNVCLNCVQIELRRILSEIRQRFFDPSAADQELLDKVLKEGEKEGERLSMLETLYIARDLLQSYSPLTQIEETRTQPPEIVPPMTSPFLITCEDMEDRIQKLTWAQLQKIARKMEVPLNQPIDWIAAQVCARIKRCDKCGQLKLGKAHS